jgi:hypothetical protein
MNTILHSILAAAPIGSVSQLILTALAWAATVAVVLWLIAMAVWTLTKTIGWFAQQSSCNMLAVGAVLWVCGRFLFPVHTLPWAFYTPGLPSLAPWLAFAGFWLAALGLAKLFLWDIVLKVHHAWKRTPISKPLKHKSKDTPTHQHPKTRS